MVGKLRVDGRIVDVETYERDGVLLRSGTYEDTILREIGRAYGWLDLRKKNVLDVGANVGLFSRLALDRGANRVVAVEPEPCNCEMLRLNAPGATIFEAAAVSDETVKNVSLYVSRSGKNPGNTSTVAFRGREEMRVAAVHFASLIEEYRIDTIKMDCEGAEYDLLSSPLPGTVRQIALEIHLNKREWRSTMARRVIDLFSDWTCVVSPNVGEKNWHTIGGWRR